MAGEGGKEKMSGEIIIEGDIVEILKNKNKYEEVAKRGTHTRFDEWVYNETLRITNEQVYLYMVEDAIEKIKNKIENIEEDIEDFGLDGTLKESEEEERKLAKREKILELRDRQRQLKNLQTRRKKSKKIIKEKWNSIFVFEREKIWDALEKTLREEAEDQKEKVKKEGVEVG